MNLKKIFPFTFTLLIILLFHISRIEFLKLYPILANLFIFLLFFSSLFRKETIIQKIAKQCERKELDEFTKNYTRKLTYVWSCFLAVNVFFAFITTFMSDEIWMLYNGFISYVLIGIFFLVEYIVRIILRKRDKV